MVPPLESILERNFNIVFHSRGGVALRDIKCMEIQHINWWNGRIAEELRKKAQSINKALEQ